MDDIYEKYTNHQMIMRAFIYYKKRLLALLSKSPKRPINTIYLKEGIRDTLLNKISDFFDDKTRDTILILGYLINALI